MKKAFAPLLFIFLSVFNGFSQEWNTDFETSKKRASENNQNILLVFSGSDWCGPCIKLDQDIWKSDAFIDYSINHLVLLKADFPKKKKNKLSKEQQLHNDALAEKYNMQGYFPFVVVLNAEGKVLGKTSYKKDFLPENYINYFSNFE